MPNYFSRGRNVLYLYPAYSWGDAPGRSKVLIYNCDNSWQFCSWKMSGTFCLCPRKRTETNFITLEVAMKQKCLRLGSINKTFKYIQCWIPLPLLVGYSVMYVSSKIRPKQTILWRTTDPSGLLIQTSAWSRINAEFRAGYPGICSVSFWKPQILFVTFVHAVIQ